MKKLLLALFWAGILMGATSACSSYCQDCDGSICLSCSYSSYYSTSKQDCVGSCSGSITSGSGYGGMGTCNDGNPSVKVIDIVLPVVIGSAVLVAVICLLIQRRRTRARLNALRYPKQNTVPAEIPMVQQNPPGYQNDMYQQIVVLPQTGGYDQNGFPIQGVNPQFAYQAQAGFNQGGYANTAYQGQVVNMQPYSQQQQQIGYQQPQYYQQQPQYYQQGYAGQNPIPQPVKM